jgi:hypothetical protein
MVWSHSSNGGAPALQELSPESKSQYHSEGGGMGSLVELRVLIKRYVAHIRFVRRHFQDACGSQSGGHRSPGPQLPGIYNLR